MALSSWLRFCFFRSRRRQSEAPSNLVGDLDNHNLSDGPVTLALKLLNYPAWQVRVDGNSLSASTAAQTGQLLVPLSAGSHHVEIDFRRTPDRTVGLFISVLSIVGLLIPAGFMRRSK